MGEVESKEGWKQNENWYVEELGEFLFSRGKSIISGP